MLSLPSAQATATAAAHDYQQTEVSGILRTLKRRLRPMIAIAIGFVIFVAILTLLLPKTYTSTIKLIAGNSSAPVGTPADSQLPVLTLRRRASRVRRCSARP
ncbi:MAG: hypothetical protein ACXVAR_14000 [Vulcanimicrobiaceae bacterium]